MFTFQKKQIIVLSSKSSKWIPNNLIVLQNVFFFAQGRVCFLIRLINVAVA